MTKNISKKNEDNFFRFTKLKTSEVKDLIKKLSYFYDDNLDQLLNYNFYKNKIDKVYIFNGNLDEIDVSSVNFLGLYFGTFHEERFRLSIEGSKFVKPKKNFIKLNEKSFQSYITAENLFEEEIEEISIEDNCPFLIVIYENENLGSVSIKEKNILTYMPKSRKLDFNKVF